MAPQAIDINQFARLYRRYGMSLTWREYGELLSRDMERTLTPNQVSAWVSRNKARLREIGIEIEPRQANASDLFPWPNELVRPYWHTGLARYLFNTARVRSFGRRSLDDDEGTMRNWIRRNKKYHREGLVIRFDPGGGFYLDKAHDDETPAGPESIKYFHQRFPEA